MSSNLYWLWLCCVCERLCFIYGQGVVIPLTSSADPLKEFEASGVKQNIFRFVIFIMVETGDAMKKSKPPSY